MKQEVSLYEKSPETRQLLRQIPRRLRLVAVWSFAGMIAGILLLATWLRFPESVAFDAYLVYEGRRHDTHVFRVIGGDRPAAFPEGRHWIALQWLDPGGGRLTGNGSAVFCRPDTLLLTPSADFSLPPNPGNLSAHIDIYTDTLPLWKKIVWQR